MSEYVNAKKFISMFIPMNTVYTYVPAIAARYNFFIFTAQPLPRANIKWSEMSLEQIAVDEIPDETV